MSDLCFKCNECGGDWEIEGGDLIWCDKKGQSAIHCKLTHYYKSDLKTENTTSKTPGYYVNIGWEPLDLREWDDISQAKQPHMVYNEQKETKMTKQEAIKKIVATNKWGYAGAETYIALLEVVGLLKFEEEKKDYLPSDLIGKENIDRLNRHGYQIVKDSK